MADVFKRTEVNFGGAFAAQSGMVLSANNSFNGTLLQNLQVGYSQNISKIYEIGKIQEKINMYMVGGRAQGTLGAQHVLGLGKSVKAYYDAFSDVCNAYNNNIGLDVKSECDGLGAQNGKHPITYKYKAKYCVITQLSLNVSANDFLIQEGSQLMFSNLEFAEEDPVADFQQAIRRIGQGLGF